MPKMSPSQIREAWIFACIAGIAALNFPFLHIFNQTIQVLGIPMLVLYFLLGWAVSIAVIFFFSRRLTFEEEKKDTQADGDMPRF